MTAQWTAINQKYQALAKRERLLLLGATLAVIYMLFELFVFKPLDERMKLALAQQQVAAQALNASEAELIVLKGLADKEPFAHIKEQKRRLTQTVAQLDNAFAQRHNELISGVEFPQALQFLLSQSESLTLRRILTSPAKSVGAERPDAATASYSDALGAATLYRFDIVLELEGDYQAFIEFLQAVETSNWHFGEQSLDLKMTHAGSASLRVTLYTLATEPGRMGN